jgi:hypothetical protein
MRGRRLAWMIWLAALVARSQSPGPQNRPVPDSFNYVLGTQMSGARYQFTKDTKLVEIAHAIQEMGSNLIKLRMSPDYATPPRIDAGPELPAIHSLQALARDEPSYRAVFDMPFAYYLIWTHTFSGGQFTDFDQRHTQAEYRELYNFTSYLLRTYSGSGKTFFLGHWEGDWMLRGVGKKDSEFPIEAAERMVLWLNTRQRAVDDAKRDTPHRNVQVYHYAEVNLVQLGIDGRECMTNQVLPKTNLDYVSYSAYDTMRDPERLRTALNYIAKHLPAKPEIAGKRVFIGEYGFPAIRSSPDEQEARSRAVMRLGLEWSCPFVLYWAMYNNEVEADGRQRGLWLINDRGEKQPVYYTMQTFYAKAREFKTAFRKEFGRLPTEDEFRREAVRILNSISTTTR